MSLKDISLQELIDMALEKAPLDVDRRTGSIIYDTVASAAVPLLEVAMEGAQIEEATFIETSYDQYLDYRVAEKAITRYQATKSIKKAKFEDAKGGAKVPIGSRFAAVDSTDSLTYSVIEELETPGEYLVECEVEGSIGNLYYGKVVPITYITDLTLAEITGDYQEARDTESDDDLRQRYLDIYKRNSFGGNVSQYDEEVKKLNGVGELQVHRAYPSSGHVTLSIVGPGYRKISNDLIGTLQETIDPEVNGSRGTGLGMAPIFHIVHVVTPSEEAIPISFKLNVMNGYTVEQLRPLIVEKLEELFADIRKNWGVLDTVNHVYDVTIYTSRIIVAVLSITGVANVTEVKINGKATDLVLEETGAKQVLPLLGTVTING